MTNNKDLNNNINIGCLKGQPLQTCLFCIYYKGDLVIGKCHRHAPCCDVDNMRALWPAVPKDESCGDYSYDQTKHRIIERWLYEGEKTGTYSSRPVFD